MSALLKMEWIQIRRNWPVFIMSVGMPLAFFLFFSSTNNFENAVLKQKFIREYMLTMTSFSMSSFALFTFPVLLKEDLNNHYLKYIEHSPLKMSQYYLSKIIRVIIYFSVSIVVTFFAGAFARGVELSVNKWLISALFLLLTSSVYLAIGLLISQINKQQVMSIVSNISFLGLAIIGGSWWPISLFPKGVQAISKLTPSYHVNHFITSYISQENIATKSLLIVLVYAIIIAALAIRIKQKREVN
ncbi:ABC transporter permease [Atopobacter phocae]|uniref:ABC transporter permease n=1 Tax=Atopobacter phocae TaxID=136492 RepID=UPI00046E6FB3|nr:ABC transporter permease [Atopobacter phocae]